jgi:quercetin dioxygenase-like cupin family protein
MLGTTSSFARRAAPTIVGGVAVVAAALIVGISRTMPARTGTRRTELQRHDLSVHGREVVQVRVDFDPGYASPKHSHPGEEIVYVLEGTLEYQIEAGAPVTRRTGDALFIPAGAIHWAKNVGNGSAAELATYVVEKGKPLVLLVGEREPDARGSSPRGKIP